MYDKREGLCCPRSQHNFRPGTACAGRKKVEAGRNDFVQGRTRENLVSQITISAGKCQKPSEKRFACRPD